MKKIVNQGSRLDKRRETAFARKQRISTEKLNRLLDEFSAAYRTNGDCMEALRLAGTDFDRIADARPWWLAIWMLERGAELNAHRLHLMAGVAYSTAWNIMRKVHSFMQGATNCRQADSLRPSGGRVTTAPGPTGRKPNAVPTEPVSVGIEPVPVGIEPVPVGIEPVPVGIETVPISFEPVPTSAASDTDRFADLTIGAPCRAIWDLLAEGPVSTDRLFAETCLSAGELCAALTYLELDGLIFEASGGFFHRASPRASSDSNLGNNRLSPLANCLVCGLARCKGHYR